MAKFGTEIWGIHDTQALLFVVYVVALDCGFCADWDGDGGMERDGPNLWVQIPGAICGILAGFNLL